MTYSSKFTKGLLEKPKTTTNDSTYSSHFTNYTLSEEYRKKYKDFLEKEALSKQIRETAQKKLEKETKKKQEKTLFSSGAFEDGYQRGDVTKTLLASNIDMGINVFKPLLNMGEGIGDKITYKAADIAEDLNFLDFAHVYRKKAAENTMDNFFKPAEEWADANSVYGEIVDGITQGLGYVWGITSIGKVAGNVGTAAGLNPQTVATIATTGTSYISSAGNAMSEALNNGATLDEAKIYSIIAGVADAGSELLFGGLGIGVNVLGLSKSLIPIDDIIAKKVSGIFKKQLAKNFAEYGIKTAAEGLEEVIAGFIQAMGKYYTYQTKEKGYDFWEIVQNENLLEQFIMGMITSGIVQTPGLIRNTVDITTDSNGKKKISTKKDSEMRDFITGYTQNEQKVIDTEVQNRVNALEEQRKQNAKDKAIDQKIKDTLQERSEVFKENLTEERKNSIALNIKENIKDSDIDYSNTKVTNKEINAIRAAVESELKSGELGFDVIENVLMGQERAQIDELFNQYDTISDDQIEQLDQLIEQAKNDYSIKLHNRIKDDYYFRPSYDEAELNLEDFQYDIKATDSEAKKQLAEDFKKKAGNSKATHNFFDLLSKFVDKTNQKIRVVNTKELREMGYGKKNKLTTEEQKKVNELQKRLENTTNEKLKKRIKGQIEDIEYFTVNGTKLDDGTILLNVDSAKALNRVLGHELMHVLESNKEVYDKISSLLEEYAKEKGEYEVRKLNTTSLYSRVYDNDSELSGKIIQEINADLMGDYVFETEFLKQVAEEEPTGLKIMLNKIKSLFKMANKDSREAKLLEEIKTEMTKALRETGNSKVATDTQTKGGTKLSIEKNGNKNYNKDNFDFDVKEGDLKNEFYDALSPYEWKKYHQKMNKILKSTYGPFARMDRIGDKLVHTVFKNGKEQVVGVIKPNESVQYLAEYVVEEINNGRYSDDEIQKFTEEMFGEGNFSRYNSTNNIYEPTTTKEGNSSRPIEENRQYDRRTIKNGSSKKNGELDNSSFSLSETSNTDSQGRKIYEANINDLVFQDEKYSKIIEEEDVGRIDIFKKILETKEDYKGFEYKDIAAPIVLRPEQVNGKWKMYDGQHRYLAYKQLGYDKIPVVFKDGVLSNNVKQTTREQFITELAEKAHNGFKDEEQREYKGYYVVRHGPTYSVYNSSKIDITTNIANWIHNFEEAKEYIDSMIFGGLLEDRSKTAPLIKAAKKNAKLSISEETQFKKLNKTTQKLQDKRNEGIELNEEEFYKLYSAHKILTKDENQAKSIIQSIQKEGFTGSGGFGMNIMSSRITYDANGEPKYFPDRKYAPREGEYVLFVPAGFIDDKGGRYRVAQGFKPKDFEIAKVERNYQPYYELYKKNFTSDAKLSISEQLANQASKIVTEDIETRNAMLENFKNYLEENDITNPTQQDIDNSIVDLLGYDNEMTPSETAKYEKLYNEVAKEYIAKQDTKYSISEAGTHGTLMAIHNLSEEKFKGILELGGFPVPSIAVTNPNLVNHREFGDISVLFDKTTIDPKNRKNEVYDRDVWSPTFPNIEYEVNSKRLKDIFKSININSENYYNLDSIQRKAELNLRQDRLEQLLDGYGLDGLKDTIKHDKEVQYSYLKSQGLIEPIYRAVKYNSEVSNEVLQQFLEQYQGSTDFSWHTKLNELDYDQTMQLSDTIKRIVKPYLEEQYGKYGKEGQDLIEKELNQYNNFNALNKFIYSANSMQRNGNVQEIDDYPTLEKVVEVLNKEEYEKWVDETFDNIISQKGIRNNKDRLTNSGTRRSFKSTHDEINLQNIVKAMTKGRTKGGQAMTIFGTGFGRISAQTSQQFKSIKDIKNNENRLMTREEAGEKILPLSERLFTNVEELAKFYKPRDYNSDVVNQMRSVDETSELIEEFAGGSLTEERFKRLLNEYNLYDVDKIPSKLLTSIIEDLNAIKNLPTDYFEAKPQRAVGLDEVQAVVIPNNINAEFKQQLQEAGLKYYEYDPNIEGDRQRVINQFDDLKFSLSNSNERTTRTSGDIYGSDIKYDANKSIIRKVQSGQALNPNEISKLTPEDANTTPILPKVDRNKVGDGDSRFASNIKNKTKMLSEEHREMLANEEEVAYYDKVTNEDSLNEAFKRLENGSFETTKWFNKESENATAVDVAEGWILLKQYADNNDTDGMVEVAKKLRDMGTKAGQTVQAFNIMSRLTPEGMVKYAQSELMEAYDKMVQGQTKKWIDENKSKFDLQPDEVKFIMDTMKEVSTMEDGYDKRVNLAQIQKIMTDKLPPAKGAGIKAWMRISMLFNPKTQVRNVAGNAIIAPVNYFGDMFAGAIDKQIAKKTGVRTTGTTNIGKYKEGFKKGLYQSYNDFKLGINTRNLEGNRFELTEGKSFNDNTKLGKALNKVDSILSFMLDAGDRGFYEAAFVNSINNQMVLNNTNEVTQEMIDIATQEALSRTWQDNNNYTKFVLSFRKGLNQINVRGYGLGDVLIPFAKTPANLTKAIVDYSPVGVINTLTDGVRLKNAIETGQFTPQMQHEFVQKLGKATAGTMLYVLGYALAKAGITSGESDEDKDVANFLKNTLGVSSYSIKIGDKTFTYDWAQPVAAPLSIMANVVNSQADDKEQALLEGIVGSLDSAGSILLEQSFLQSFNDVINSIDGPVSGLITEVLELPSRAIPTLSKQIVDLTDSTQRQTYVKGQPVKSALFYAISKLPGVSQGLAPQVDTLGREIKRYGGKNNLFNVLLNPANVNTENVSEAAQEIYDVYKSTSDKTVMPRVADYTYKNKDGVTIPLTTHQRAKLQKESGQIVEENVSNLLNEPKYNNLSDVDKAAIINNIVNYAYNKAKNKVLGTEMSNQYNKVEEYVANGGIVSDYYLNKKEVDYSLNYPEKYDVITQITTYDNYKEYQKEIDALIDTYSTTAQRKSAVISYVNSLDLSIVQKAMLIKLNYSSYDTYDNQIINYINNQNLSREEKDAILKKLGLK